MSFKTFTNQHFPVVEIIVQLSTAISKPKGYLEAPISSGNTYTTITYNITVKSTSFFGLYFYNIMM